MNRLATRTKRLAAAVLAAILLLVGAAPALAEVFSAVVLSDAMPVYGDAALTNKVDTLQKDAVVRVVDFTGTVAKISYGGKKGYARISDMKAVEAVAEKAIINEACKVYESLSMSARSAKAPAGLRVYVLSREGGWARIERDGVTAYIGERYLSFVDDDGNILPDPTATPAPTAAPGDPTVTESDYPAVALENTKVYKSASTSSKVLGTLKKGTQVTVKAYSSDGWARIELKGKSGYCRLSALEAAKDPEPTATPKPKTAVVTADSLTVYEEADTGSRKLGTLKKGRTVNLISKNSQWAYIELNGQYGYCTVLGLSEVESEATPAPTEDPELADAKIGTVIVKSLTVYQSASTKAKRLGTLKKGQKVNVLGVSGKWARIELNGHYGYCSVRGLTLSDPEPTATPKPSTDNAMKAVVAEPSVSVYEKPDVDSRKLGTLKKGREVNVISWENGWAFIELNGRYGYCALDALTRKDQPGDLPSGFKRANFTATVIDPQARVYESPSQFTEYRALTLGAEVNVVAYSKDWAYVSQNGQYGYVEITQLSKTAYEPVEGDGQELLTLTKALLNLGYYDSVPSEKTNAAAASAIRRFQNACGLEETGTADQTMQRILYGGAAPESDILSKDMEKGEKGDNVSRLQARLYALGYLSKSSSLTGQYGAYTVSAVKLFQSASNITSTGVADVQTLRALYSTGAKLLPSGVKPADASGGGSSGNTYLDEVPDGLASTVSEYSDKMSNPEKLEYVIYVAQNQLGKPYVYACAGPDKFDCSGLTTYIFKKIGVSLKRSAYDQGYDETYPKVEGWENLKRGDLVFFNTISDSDLSDHAGVYIGDGYFIHASSGGHRVVVSNLTGGYYNRVFSWGRRVLN